MKILNRLFLSCIAWMGIPHLASTAFNSTAFARYQMSNPIVAGGSSSNNWYYPSQASANNVTDGNSLAVVNTSPSAIMQVQNELQNISSNAAAWQQTDGIIKPMYVPMPEGPYFKSNFNLDENDEAQDEVDSWRYPLSKSDKKQKYSQGDEYASRKQNFKNALTGLLAQYASDEISKEELAQKEQVVFAQVRSDLMNDVNQSEEQIRSDLQDIADHYDIRKMKIDYVKRLSPLAMPEDMMELQEEIIYPSSEFNDSRFNKPRARASRLAMEQQEPYANRIIPLKPLSVQARPVKNVPLDSDALPEESVVILNVPTEVAPHFLGRHQTLQEKKNMIDTIHNKHAPLMVKTLKARGHRGMVSTSMVKKLLKDLEIEHLFSAQDISYLQGVVQADF